MLAQIQHLIQQYRNQLPVAFFVGGFAWDSITLSRIDKVLDNLFLFGYWALAGVCIFIYTSYRSFPALKLKLRPYKQYLPYAIQFFFGGLCSAYVVFFFQSVSMTKTLIFFGVLVLILVLNEWFENRLTNPYLLLATYYFLTFTYLIFVLPVLFSYMNTLIFILSGLLSLAFIWGFIKLLLRYSPVFKRILNTQLAKGVIAGVFLLINLAYYFNIIPPIPLSLREAKMAHRVTKTDNTYQIAYEQAPWYKFWKSAGSTFHYQPDDTVFCYTSVFAPADLQKSILHQWKRYDSTAKQWLTTDRLNFSITGGRAGGYRGYTYKRYMNEGLWKVEVLTGNNMILGIIEFRVVAVDSAREVEMVTVSR